MPNPNIHVRQARLDDAQAVSGLFRAHIHTWQRMNANGQVEDVDYEALTIYERWLHGGAWMSVETGAIHLSHLLRGAGIPVVAEWNGHVSGYAEVYPGSEPAPVGNHLHLTNPTLHPDAGDAGLDHALIAYALEQAKILKSPQVTVSFALQEFKSLYEQHGFRPLTTVRRFNLPARTGQGFYRTAESLDDSASRIAGWYMPVGRLTSARQQWETLWPRVWDAIPEIKQRRAQRIHFNAAGQEALVWCQQPLYIPRSAEVACWSPKPLTPQLLTAIRDWAHREGYRTLIMAVAEDTVKTLGAEAEPDGYVQETYTNTL
jgi:GNAT superfamily N-acetyltransferase